MVGQPKLQTVLSFPKEHCEEGAFGPSGPWGLQGRDHPHPVAVGVLSPSIHRQSWTDPCSDPRPRASLHHSPFISSSTESLPCSPSSSGDAEPIELIWDRRPVSGDLILSPLKSGAKAFTGIHGMRAQPRSQTSTTLAHSYVWGFILHITPEVLSPILVWNYLMLPRWILHSFLMQNLAVNDRSSFNSFLIHRLLFK